MIQELTLEQAEKFIERIPTQSLTFFHLPRYLQADASRDPSYKPLFLAAEHEGEFFFQPAQYAPIAGLDFFDLQSPFGYGGGPIWSQNPSSSFFNECKKAYLKWCQKSKIVAEFVRFYPIDNAKNLFFGTTQQLRPTMWINLGQKNLIQTYGARTRAAIRETLSKGVTVQWTTSAPLPQDFYPLYLETMKNLGSTALTNFSEAYFRSLALLSGVHYVECRHQGKLLGGALFLHHDSTFDLHLFASIFEGTQFNILGLLLHSGLIRGQEFGCRTSHLGGGFDSKFGDPLYRFKTTFAGKESPYFIGSCVYNKPVYEAMKTRWIQQNGTEPQRILFYRKGV